MVTRIGLDLGYANITLSDSAAEIYREPSIALIRREASANLRRIIAVGNEALVAGAEGSGEAKDGMLVRPFKNGLLFDHQITQEVILGAIKPVFPKEKIRCVLGVPSDINPKQEKELFGMLNEAGVHTCLSVARPLAAIIGAGYSPFMSVISVNIGAQSTEIAVLHKGQIIRMSRIPVGGEDFDKAVKQYIQDQGELSISLVVARAIKEKLGAVWKGKPNESIDIEGTLSLTGNKLKMNVTTEDIVGVFEKPLAAIIHPIVEIVEKIPLDAVEDIFENGIVLTGGGAELFGMKELLSKVLGISVTKPAFAMDCVAKGLARINAFIPTVAKVDKKNVTYQVAEFYENSKKKGKDS